jgi:aminopeptidase N
MSITKNIVAIGGGGFGRISKDNRIEDYILSLSSKENPNICFIPTATGDNDAYKVNYYDVFTKFNCNPTHIDFFKRTVDLSEHISKQDIIFVGGGNTKSMLAVWKDWGLDILLKDAYEGGTVMSGVSAGAICWFERGITDSWAHDLAIMDCLGFVKGNCCPHYDEEPARRPFVKKALQKDLIDHCLSIEGNCALHIKDDYPFKAVNFGNEKNTYRTTITDGEVLEDAFKRIDL